MAPERDFVFAAFGNAPQAMMLHDQILLWLLRDRVGGAVPDLVPGTEQVSDLSPYAGTYRSNQLRVDVQVVDGELEEQMTYEPQDEEQKRISNRFAGVQSDDAMPPRRYTPLREGLFAPAAMPLQAFNGYARLHLVSYHGRSGGRALYRDAGGRITRRDDAA